MPELTEQEKLERRRQKRQQRILNSAENRLNKITGTAFPHRASPTPSPSTSASSLARSETPQRRSPSPSPAVFAAPSTSTETLRSRRSIRPLDSDPSEDLGAPFAASSDATLPAIDNMFGGGGAAPAGPPNLPTLNDLFSNGQFPFNPAIFANMQQQQQPLDRVPDTSSKYWNLLHFVSMIWLGIYAVYTEWRKGGTERFASLLTTDPAHSDYPAIQFPLFWYFIILELLLHSARSMYQQGDASGGSLLAGLMQYLPPQVADTANVTLRYWLIISSLIKDCLVLVFVIAMDRWSFPQQQNLESETWNFLGILHDIKRQKD